MKKEKLLVYSRSRGLIRLNIYHVIHF